MKRAAAFLCLLLASAMAFAAKPSPLGQFERWGAFRATGPERCYAIAQPQGRVKEADSFATVTTWPARRLSRQLHIRFRRAIAGAVVTVAGRRFPMAVAGMDGWARSAGEAPRIAALMRDGSTMRVLARDSGGRRFTDVYLLAGVGSAIDAAGTACLHPR